MLKYQKFQAPISKRDVLFKNDQMSWIMKKPNEKLLTFLIILLWEVIYAHFYNWNRLLDFVPVVYDLIELIIETSLWSKDYSTFGTHPQHTSLMFNEYLFHLCDCTCSNVMCVCSTICGSNQKDFCSFCLLLEVICISYVFQSFSSCFCVKKHVFWVFSWLISYVSSTGS